MTLEKYQNKFTDIMSEIKNENDRMKFLKWIKSNWNFDCFVEEDVSSKEVLNTIADDLRSMLPFDAILPSEAINLPVCGPNSDCELKTTVHVDEFLYSDEYIDELVEKGLMSRHYCSDCFSRNTKLLTFISHSMSINRIQYLFRYLLPPLETETILDVGSRLGPVLYGAYLLTSSPKIIGIEMNFDFCKIQTEIVEKYKFSDRIQIICNSILNESHLLSSADVIILNNVFEFFADVDTVITSWNFLAENIKPGCILITIPHLIDTFKHVKIAFDWKDWVEELQPHLSQFSCDDEEMENHQQNVKHYRVIQAMKFQK